MSVTPAELVRIAARAADSKKAEDIVALDLHEISDVCDYFVICSASNARLLDAVVEEIEEKVKANGGGSPLSIEGRVQRNWVLVDYGSVVIHVFLPETREHYRLEHLWGDASNLELKFNE